MISSRFWKFFCDSSSSMWWWFWLISFTWISSKIQVSIRSRNGWQIRLLLCRIFLVITLRSCQENPSRKRIGFTWAADMFRAWSKAVTQFPWWCFFWPLSSLFIRELGLLFLPDWDLYSCTLLMFYVLPASIFFWLNGLNIPRLGTIIYSQRLFMAALYCSGWFGLSFLH